MEKFWHFVKELFIRLGLVLLSLIVLFLVFEFFFQMFRGTDSWLKLASGRANSKFHHSLQPDTKLDVKTLQSQELGDFHARINNYGLRGRDISIKKPEGVLRILMVGDSFTFGIGENDDETIPYYFEQLLQENNNNIEVINCGMGLLCPTLHYLNIRDRYLQLSPDVVFLLIDLTDLWDDWEMERQLIYDKEGNIIRCDPSYSYGKKDWWFVLCQHSKFADWIHDKIIRAFQKMRILGFWRYISLKSQGKKAKGEIAKSESGKLDLIRFDGLYFTRGRAHEENIRKHWQRTGKFILMIRDIVEKNGADFIMVVYPYGMQVGPNQWAKGRTFWGFEEGKIYDDYFCFELMQEFAQENNIAFVNLLPDFLENKDRKLFFDYDGHFTAEANRISAQALAQSPIVGEMLLKKLKSQQ